jgi:hypothetical protein
MLKVGFTPQNYLDSMKILNEFIDKNNYLHSIFFNFILSPESSEELCIENFFFDEMQKRVKPILERTDIYNQKLKFNYNDSITCKNPEQLNEE